MKFSARGSGRRGALYAHPALVLRAEPGAAAPLQSGLPARSAEPMNRSLLRTRSRQSSRHHDALRLRFVRGAAGWRQFYCVPSEQSALWLDLSQPAAGEPEQASRPDAAASRNQPRPWRTVRCGAPSTSIWVPVGQAGCWWCHHLAIDGVSWRPLLEDLETAYRQLSEARAVRLPPRRPRSRCGPSICRSTPAASRCDRNCRTGGGDRLHDRARQTQPCTEIPQGPGQNTEGSSATIWSLAQRQRRHRP